MIIVKFLWNVKPSLTFIAQCQWKKSPDKIKCQIAKDLKPTFSNKEGAGDNPAWEGVLPP